VSLNAQPRVVFDEPLDQDAVNAGNVSLRDARGSVACTIALAEGDTTIAVAPSSALRRNASYRLVLRGGQGGIRDRAGNALAQDLEIAFRTADDSTLPEVILLPADGASAVATGSHISAVFDSIIDPASVTAETLTVATRSTGAAVPGTVSVVRNDRGLRFLPREPWAAGTWYRVTLRGGPAGVRELSGNWLASDATHDFRIGFTADTQRPNVRVSLNAAADLRKNDMQVPQAGFTIDVYAQDPTNYALDPTSFELTLVGPGGPPGSDPIFAQATVARDHLRWRVPASAPLAVGDYQLLAKARDLSGNEGVAETIRFSVVEPATNKVPFERTHAVWVRTDLDRDGSGRSDFLDDLISASPPTAIQLGSTTGCSRSCATACWRRRITCSAARPTAHRWAMAPCRSASPTAGRWEWRTCRSRSEASIRKAVASATTVTTRLACSAAPTSVNTTTRSTT
jgi:hypothetical protein